jgi:uncharacterized surface protein with fasciclin (FAS1) repeats
LNSKNESKTVIHAVQTELRQEKMNDEVWWCSGLFLEGVYLFSLCVLSDDFGLDHNTAKKVACRFGAGISETGNTCGAVSGAILDLGLKYGKVNHIKATPAILVEDQSLPWSTSNKVAILNSCCGGFLGRKIFEIENRRMDPLYGEELVNMKKTKTIFILLAIAMVAIVVIAGCTQPTPPATPSPTPSPTAAPKTIVVIAVDDGRFTTLVAAVQAADLATTLNGPGPFTVFAPTDDAFKKLPAGTVDTLLKDPQGQLKQILLYHVVSGSYTTDQLVQMKSVQTLQGGYLNITEMNGTVMVNDATIVVPNIKASNGMIQVIDSVLLPP